MAYAIQTAFGAGELTPELHERTTLEKYKTGLKTLRNAVVTKVGSIKSRPGSEFYLSSARPRLLRDKVLTFDHTTDSATVSSTLGMVTGLAVTLQTSNTLPAALGTLTTYYIIVVDSITVKFATSLSNAGLGIAISLSDDGTGSHTLLITDKAKKKCIIYNPPFSNYLIEFGPLYVRIHDIIAGDYADGAHMFDEDDLPYIQFAHNGDFLYISSSNETLSAGSNQALRVVLVDLVSGDPNLATRVSALSSIVPNRPSTPFSSAMSLVATGSQEGYDVEYLVTLKIGKEELLPHTTIPVSGKLPVAASQYNTIEGDFDLFTYQTDYAIEMRVYRRPKDGQAYGFIGSTNTYSDASSPPYTTRTFTFRDAGQSADFTNLPPTFQEDFALDNSFTSPGSNLKPSAIGIYQERFVMSGSITGNTEATFASRPGFPQNFLRDYPLSADSALAMKAGTNGTAKVLRYADLGGLAAFTTQGIYMTPVGPLTPETAVMLRRGGYVIDDIVAPLELPGAVIFVDKTINGVVAIKYSDEQASFDGSEISIYSNHLFLNNRIVSWAYQGGKTPLVWCVMEDGSLVLLTYQNEQLVRAWSRGDTDGNYESVTVHNKDGVSTVYMVVERNDERMIETMSIRDVSDLKDYIGMDSTVTYKSVLEADFTLTPVVANDWDGELTLTASSAVFSNSAGSGNIGTIFRYFHPTENYSIDLEVTAYTSTTVLTVQADKLFPSADNEFKELYKTTTGITGLDHLEGKDVAVMLDGFVEASPYNTESPKHFYTVTSGSINLDSRGAVVHVGLPFVVDIETLDVETVEQKPTLLESIVCNKVDVKLYNSRGFWVGQRFGDDDTNEGMQSFEREYEPIGSVSVAPKALQPYTERVSVEIEGDWESKGRVAIRQVDPLPLEISSIIPDIQVEYRTDRR